MCISRGEAVLGCRLFVISWPLSLPLDFVRLSTVTVASCWRERGQEETRERGGALETSAPADRRFNKEHERERTHTQNIASSSSSRHHQAESTAVPDKCALLG